VNKLKTKYKNVAQCIPESLSISTALLAIYNNVVVNTENPETE
jgi:hypothetical protein